MSLAPQHTRIVEISWLSLVAIVLTSLIACQPKKIQENSHFPPSVQITFTNKCATAGCHNEKSYRNAGGLNLSSWEALFAGGNNGSVVVPYAPFQSSLLQFINSYVALGLSATPRMPLNDQALSYREVSDIRSWILQGCPDTYGHIPFADHAATRGKAYITNQGCDLVDVIDADTRMIMRSIKVGKDSSIIEQPHNIKMSPDGKYWYVCFSNGSWLQKYDAVADTLVGEVNISAGKWNVIYLSRLHPYAWVSDFSSNGRIVLVDINLMTVLQTFASGLFSNPHGITATSTEDTLYATSQYGNMIYRIIPGIPQIDNIPLQNGVAPVLTPGLLDPHEIMFSPDYRYYFVTCQTSNELRVMDAHADTLLKVIPLGTFPLEMAISKQHQSLFITCQEDANPLYSFFKGSVYVVDLNTLTVTHKIYERFYQPHGLAVDDTRDLLYVASTNANPSGPAPHHVSECAGRNGFFHVIRMSTWESLTSNAELSVFPYSVSTKP